MSLKSGRDLQQKLSVVHSHHLRSLPMCSHSQQPAPVAFYVGCWNQLTLEQEEPEVPGNLRPNGSGDGMYINAPTPLHLMGQLLRRNLLTLSPKLSCKTKAKSRSLRLSILTHPLRFLLLGSTSPVPSQIFLRTNTSRKIHIPKSLLLRICYQGTETNKNPSYSGSKHPKW